MYLIPIFQKEDTTMKLSIYIKYTSRSLLRGGQRTIVAIDPAHYPLVAPPTFIAPSNGTLSHLLIANRVVVSQNFLNTSGRSIGDRFNVYIKSVAGSGQTLQVTIAGVVANEGIFAQS